MPELDHAREAADAMLAMGQAVLRAQPFSVLLGVELTRFDEGGVELRLPMRRELQQQNGFAHGGVLSYLADNAATYAAGPALGPGLVTAEFKINYIRPGIGDMLIARGSLVHAGKRQAVTRAEIFAVANGEENLVAVAQATIGRMESKSGDAA